MYRRWHVLLLLIVGLLFSLPVFAEPTWKWVKATNLIDKWVIEEGLAEVTISNKVFEAILYKPGNLETPYIRLVGTINADSWVVVTQKVETAGTFNKFRGARKISRWKGFENHSGVETITLSDGWSMIGLTKEIVKSPSP